jgi:radical SAM enzyme (TIGR01210 family)
MGKQDVNPESATRQILQGTRAAAKDHAFDEAHDPSRPADYWFQESDEGPILFVVFYSQACRWSRCLGCNLPARMSSRHVPFSALMAQVDYLFRQPDILQRAPTLRKVIVSNNGSVLDEVTFSSTALIYLMAKLNLHLANLAVVTLETRIEYVDLPELEFLARALREGQTPTELELAIGFEVFDDRIRNEVFHKGLQLRQVDELCGTLARYGYHLKCYFMQKPVPGMSDAEAMQDIHRAIDYLTELVHRHGTRINMHLNPTYVALGTALERSYRRGEYSPPRLADVAHVALYAEGKPITLFVGLSDEGLACQGGSFIRPGDEALVAALEVFNRTQDFAGLKTALATGGSRPGEDGPRQMELRRAQHSSSAKTPQ